ncbi:protocadherin Fat 2-like [Hyalella azteca]|uniref:Protocadherin Fat 2-like n=1 Tax=Hyalella azteca TaxID=294128 RepID=A0A979FLF2_HYAAZ|nr:protocadherin Fat 2-like [Hyalella azteca]
MDPASFLKIITNSTFMVTQLFGRDPVQFDELQYNITVSEDAPLGPLLTLTAITYPEGESVHYSLVESSHRPSSKWFKINPSSGVLLLVQPLDYEQNKRVSRRHDVSALSLPTTQPTQPPYYTRVSRRDDVSGESGG